MYRCANCDKVDRFELMFSSDYKGDRIIKKDIKANGDIEISVDNYKFIPDLKFMNEHAVCNYCGSINCWELDK